MQSYFKVSVLYTIPRVDSVSTCHSLPDLHLLHGKENPCQGEDIVGNWIAIVFVGEIQRNSLLLMRTLLGMHQKWVVGTQTEQNDPKLFSVKRKTILRQEFTANGLDQKCSGHGQ